VLKLEFGVIAFISFLNDPLMIPRELANVMDDDMMTSFQASRG
jgi:hypothetical protein